MVKNGGSGHRPTSSYAKRKQRKQLARWLPLALVGVLAVTVGIVIGRGFTAPKSPGNGPRAEEWLAGVSGRSYDNGATQHTYPDPGGRGPGRQWLPALGRDDAPVLVVEYSDIFCSHCRAFNLLSLPGILEAYVATGQVRYVSAFFGFANAVQQGSVSAEMCAAEQGRYFEFRHALFQTIEVGGYNIERAAGIAGLEMGAFSECRAEQRYNPALQEIVFVNNQGVDATPTFFINGEEVSGNRPERIKELIELALETAGH